MAFTPVEINEGMKGLRVRTILNSLFAAISGDVSGLETAMRTVKQDLEQLGPKIDKFHEWKDIDEYKEVKIDLQGHIFHAIDAEDTQHEYLPTVFHNGIQSEEIEDLQDGIEKKVDKIDGKGLIDSNVANSLESLTEEQWLKVSVDKNNKILFGIDKNGNVFVGRLVSPTLDSIKEKISPKARLVAPSSIPCVVGKEQYLYFENIINNGWLEDYRIELSSTEYSKRDGKYIINPSEVGDSSLTIYLKTKLGAIVDTKTITLKAVSSTPSSTYKMVVIGDSKTANCAKLSELVNLCSKDENLSVEFLGTRTLSHVDSDGVSRTIKAEGYSGKNIVTMCQSQTFQSDGITFTNPFYDSSLSSTNKFSIAYYINNSLDGVVPDIVWIDHGANQTATSWSTVKACYDFIIADIAAYNLANGTSIKVVISVQETNSLTQRLTSPASKWVMFYGSSKPSNYLSAFEGRESEGIFVCPQFVNVDYYNDYPTCYAPTNIRNNGMLEKVCLDSVHMGMNTGAYSATKTYNRGDIFGTSQKDMYLVLKNGTIGIEPTDDKITYSKAESGSVDSGYYKVADMYFATLKYISSINN